MPQKQRITTDELFAQPINETENFASRVEQRQQNREAQSPIEMIQQGMSKVVSIPTMQQLPERIKNAVISRDATALITPEGININLKGFASDAEGSEGLTGELDNKNLEKFLAFYLLKS